MKNYLFISDIHIIESELEEINIVFDELSDIIDKHNITHIFNCGDTFDKVYPSILELKCFAEWIKKINKPMTIISANSHESISQTISVLDLFGILKDTITVVKDYQDDHRLFLGHFIVKEAFKNIGATISKSELKRYLNVILGHQHDYQIIKPNICQLGSIRYIDFGEDPAIKKKVAICHNYGEQDQGWEFIDLKSPYPLIDIELNSNNNNKLEEKVSKETPKNAQNVPLTPLSNKKGKSPKLINKPEIAPSNHINPSSFGVVGDLCSFLDKTSPKSKVRIVFKDYGSWVEFLPFYKQYKDKFFVFRDKKDFLVTIDNTPKDSKKESMKESLIKWMIANKIEEKIQKILLEEIR